MTKVRLAEAARADLRDIRIYSKAAFGADTAHAYLKGLRKSFRLLSDQLFAAAGESDLGESIRGFSYRSHRLYYRIEHDDVLIIRILHHARDAAQLMDPEI